MDGLSVVIERLLNSLLDFEGPDLVSLNLLDSLYNVCDTFRQLVRK